MRPRTSWSLPSLLSLQRCRISPLRSGTGLPTQLTVTVRLRQTPAGSLGDQVWHRRERRAANGPPLYQCAIRLSLLGLPEDLADLVDLAQQLVGHRRVGAGLGATASACQLGGLVEEGVQLRVLLEVRRLEVVGP